MTVKEIRSHYNLTQQQLSAITGIPCRTIGNWETGSRKPAEYIPDLIQAKVELTLMEYNKALEEAEKNND